MLLQPLSNIENIEIFKNLLLPILAPATQGPPEIDQQSACTPHFGTPVELSSLKPQLTVSLVAAAPPEESPNLLPPVYFKSWKFASRAWCKPQADPFILNMCTLN